MSTDTQSGTLSSIVLYTAAPRESAVVVLRVTGPAERAGIRVLSGNQGPNVSPDLVTEADLVVIQRDFPRFWPDYKQVISEARYYGKPVLYDLDDLLVEMPGEHSHAGDYMGELLAMLHAILNADMVTASSNSLVEYLSELNPNTRLVKNYLNDDLWQIKTSRVGDREDRKVLIGYMGGQTHQADLTLVEDILLRICENAEEEVRLRFWGVQPPPKLMESPFTEWIDINQEEYAAFAEFFSQQDCDIFIAPLRDNEFNRAKSSLKFLEYSALGIPGVYSKLPPYEGIIQNGVNGFLAENVDEWEKNLTKLIDDPILRNEIGAAAQKNVIDDWLLSEKYGELAEVYQQALSGSPEQVGQSREHDNLLRIISLAEDYQADLENSLYEVGNQLNDILESRSWKSLKTMQNLRQRIMPKGGTLDRLLFGGEN
ncbi:MAG: glycosyltransferase [Chloroflexota bacterium]|nr:MAG: glycosyltransferase [Chloroflexota bacterium]